jgi:hypothetical protein
VAGFDWDDGQDYASAMVTLAPGKTGLRGETVTSACMHPHT